MNRNQYTGVFGDSDKASAVIKALKTTIYDCYYKLITTSIYNHFSVEFWYETKYTCQNYLYTNDVIKMTLFSGNE